MHLEVLLSIEFLFLAPWIFHYVVSEIGYPVYSVTECPMNRVVQRLSSKRLGCNDTNIYHCVPNHNLSTLLEFCYGKARTRVLFKGGGCLKLLESGYLESINCENFCGCPDRYFYADEVYQYPVCLQLMKGKGCFNTDLNCSKQITNSTSTGFSNSCQNERSVYASVIIVQAVLLLLILIYCICQKKCRHAEPRIEEKIRTVCRDGDYLRYFALIGQEQFNLLALNSEVDENGWSILHHSAYGGSARIFRDLLETKQLNIEQTTTNLETVLHIAAKHGKLDICSFILETSTYRGLFARIDKYKMNPAHTAARYGQIEVMQIMVDSGCNVLEKVEKSQENIAIFACIGEHLEMLKFIGSNATTKKALHEKNYEGWNTVHYASKIGNCDLLEYLIGEAKVDGINRSLTKKNCLHTACEKGHYEACKYLVKHVPRILYLKDCQGNHAGHFAARNGNLQIMKFLSDRGLNIAETNTDNESVLHVACLYGQLELTKYISNKYPNLVNKETNRLWNAAMFIAERGGDEDQRIKILDYLVKKNLDVYCIAGSGKTALWLACKNRSLKLCEHLLKNYPRFSDTNYGCMDPLEAADGDSRIKRLIEKYNSKSEVRAVRSRLKQYCNIL